MMTTTLLGEGLELNIEVEPPGNKPAFFIFGLKKSGSTLLNKITVALCYAATIPIISIPNEASNAGLTDSRWQDCKALNALISDGYCYRGFREYPGFLASNQLTNQRKKIWLIRDPRDVVVSAYFSFKQSHVIPKGGGELAAQRLAERAHVAELSLEEFVLDYAETFKATFQDYLDNLKFDSNLKIYRYEDIVFSKESWIQDIASFLDLKISPARITRIAERNHQIPKQEDQFSHIRRVIPGDHIEKLSAECIQKLNGIFEEILIRFDYSI